MVAFITSEYEHLKGVKGMILFISQICPDPRKEIIENEPRKMRNLAEGPPSCL